MGMKTAHLKPEQIQREWVLVDAENAVLGDLASQVAQILRGKTKPTFSPHLDQGDFVVVINASQINFSGNKLLGKRYYNHSGYPGGLRTRVLGDVFENDPTEVVRRAVKGMLPKNKLAKHQLAKLKIYPSGDHPHQAQQPRLDTLTQTVQSGKRAAEGTANG
jgi:large subunit ribosomal protein L13